MYVYILEFHCSFAYKHRYAFFMFSDRHHGFPIFVASNSIAIGMTDHKNEDGV